MIELTRELIDTFKTDSDVIDYAEEHGIDKWDLFEEIAQFNARGTVCEGCKYAQMYPSMYPCNSCSRIVKDMYEERHYIFIPF